MDACDANSRNTIHRRSQLCDKVLLIWLRHHDIRAVWYNLYKFIGNSWTFVQLCCRKGQNRTPNRLSHRIASQKLSQAQLLRWPAMALLRQLHGVRDGCDLGISRFRGCRIACRIAKKLLWIPLKAGFTEAFCNTKRDATWSAMDACDANSRNTIHRRSQRCDNALLIWCGLVQLVQIYGQLYNFAVEKVKIACRIAKVEPTSTSAMAQLRQLCGWWDGCHFGRSHCGKICKKSVVTMDSWKNLKI